MSLFINADSFLTDICVNTLQLTLLTFLVSTLPFLIVTFYHPLLLRPFFFAFFFSQGWCGDLCQTPASETGGWREDGRNDKWGSRVRRLPSHPQLLLLFSLWPPYVLPFPPSSFPHYHLCHYITMIMGLFIDSELLHSCGCDLIVSKQIDDWFSPLGTWCVNGTVC